MGVVPGRSTWSLAGFMSLSAIEEEVLWSRFDDYESPRTIFAGVGERVEQPVTEESVRAILLSLADRGYVRHIGTTSSLGSGSR
jgi:hypothetical protein